jgi:hypothetical protein
MTRSAASTMASRVSGARPADLGVLRQGGSGTPDVSDQRVPVP